MIHVYAASNAQPQREKIFATQKSFERSERSFERRFYQQFTNFDGASEASGILLAINSKV